MVFLILLCSTSLHAQERLGYHRIKTDSRGQIISWAGAVPGAAFDRTVNLVWAFWEGMRTDFNGLPYYMNHQVWKPDFNDGRGLGGDQHAMALSSWNLLYAYTGNERVKENMRGIADWYLTHSLSPQNAAWPFIPYPYNTLVYSGLYDGDMILGKDYTQPDKAGAFGYELVQLYKLMSKERYPNVTYQLYLDAAIKIANTLAAQTKGGDSLASPLPFKVNAITGEVGVLKSWGPDGKPTGLSDYTSNWGGTLDLFLSLKKLGLGDTAAYSNAFNKMLAWMKRYPMQNNRWGPFFEDISGWSDTQINAITWAQFMMRHPEYFPQWRSDVKKIFDWVYQKLGNRTWIKYGVVAVNEQTAYEVPGNSHTSRQASAQLQYIRLTGDTTGYNNALRQLAWATYMVAEDGRNRYPQDEVWLTDGYGDYVRHYLRAMGDAPELAPVADKILHSTSVVAQVFYAGQFNKHNFPPIEDTAGIQLRYTAFDAVGEERIRMKKKPRKLVWNDGDAKSTGNAFQWTPISGGGGLLIVTRTNSNTVNIY